MQSNDLSSKKRNNKQNTSEEFATENVPENYDPAATKLEAEVKPTAVENKKCPQGSKY